MIADRKLSAIMDHSFSEIPRRFGLRIDVAQKLGLLGQIRAHKYRPFGRCFGVPRTRRRASQLLIVENGGSYRIRSAIRKLASAISVTVQLIPSGLRKRLDSLSAPVAVIDARPL